MNIVGMVIVGVLQLSTSADGVFTAPFARRFPIPEGETWFTGDAQIVGFYFQSNIKYPIADYTYRFLHHLSDESDSETYRSGDMAADQEVLMDLSTYWDAPLIQANVLSIGAPRLSDPVSRVGNVIEYEVTVPMTMVSV